MENTNNEVIYNIYERAYSLMCEAVDAGCLNGPYLQNAKSLIRDFADAKAKYPMGTEVFVLVDETIVRARVLEVSGNVHGSVFYRIAAEDTGRNVCGGQWVSERRLFASREDMIGHYRGILGI